jgi:hypothetical protein
VEDHLDEVGGAFLPKSQWCPWLTRVLQELDTGETYGQLASNADLAGASDLCISLKNKDASDDSKLILDRCGGPGWRLDGDGLFHSEANDEQCMQAGRAGPPKDGEKVRMFACDSSNELQQFVYESEGEQWIKPKGDSSLCVVFRGTVPNPAVDPIILKKCDKVKKNERYAWTGDV